jgi:hypothetical protein
LPILTFAIKQRSGLRKTPTPCHVDREKAERQNAESRLFMTFL